MKHTKFFTFHYVSIISYSNALCVFCILLYLPLCFYYFLHPDRFRDNLLRTLHSIMFLLFHSSKPELDQRNATFTFHYVSIISDQKDQNTDRGISFTFHDVSIISAWLDENGYSLEDFTFHYVSIISGTCISDRSYASYIYIPLCFYYFSGRNSPGNAYNNIYIPLCFYYFTKRQSGRLKQICLYLHSIMFLLFPNIPPNISSDAVFTFHYVSIISS